MTASELTTPSQTLFELRAPLLSEGREDTVCAASDALTVTVKVYASGGENSLHAHPGEDHSFLVLSGRARFEFGDGTTAELSQYQGVLLPRGTFYKFQSIDEGNLVMLRTGAPVEGHAWDRVDSQHRKLTAGAGANNHVSAVRVEGQFFGSH